MTQAGLAKDSGIAPGTIGDIEADRQKGSKYIDRIATALQTTAAALRDGTKVSAAEQLILAATLSHRESLLIRRFRDMSDANKGRLEAFAAGVPVVGKKRKRSISQTVQEISTAKTRRAS